MKSFSMYARRPFINPFCPSEGDLTLSAENELEAVQRYALWFARESSHGAIVKLRKLKGQKRWQCLEVKPVDSFSHYARIGFKNADGSTVSVGFDVWVATNDK